MSGNGRGRLSRSVPSKCKGGSTCYVSIKLLFIEYMSCHLAFRCVHKIVKKTVSFVTSVCLHGTTQLPQVGFL